MHAAATRSPLLPRSDALIGRTFVNPAIDYLFVGGGVTLPIFAALFFFPQLTPIGGDIPFWSFMAINAAHFAASSVRLYTKPGAREEFPFLTWVFPILCFAVVGLGLYWPRAGGHIKALYFTWSPFHYAAQTYGLAVMYAMRSGARLEARDKQLVWWVCLLPFLHAFFTTHMGGLFWFVSRETIASHALAQGLHTAIVALLRVAVLLLPVALFWQLHRMRGKRVPLISLLLQVTNGLWWLGSDYLNAWFWTAIFHSIQYLIVATVRHIDERVPRGSAARGLRPMLLHGTAFYGFSLAAGVVLFVAAPSAFAALGFSWVESYAMMTLVINLHHFIVDGFIWRTPRPGEQNAPAPLPVAA